MNSRITKWVSSAPGEFWKNNDIVDQESEADSRISINVHEQKQKISGWGGCFNERGWTALLSAEPEVRELILRDFFDPVDGCKFSLCRMPIGASDFAVDMYSLDDHEGDFAMEHFSIERDKKYLIPFIEAAMKYNPELKVWASPWSPPAWLKTSGEMICGHLREDEESRKAYALYFQRFVEEYQKQGIPLFAIMPQNEPCWESLKYPACGYTIEENYDFMKNYLVPQFVENHVNCEIWVGTILNPEHGITTGFDFVDRVLSDESLAGHIGGVGLQYGKKAMKKTYEEYPDVELMMTETNCGEHENDYAYAESQFDDIVTYMEHGASSFMLWNMVLDETGSSLAGWQQNSPVVVHSDTKEVDWNAQYYAYKHFSRFVDKGSHRLECQCSGVNGTAFLAPDEQSIVVCFRNPDEKDKTVSIELNGQTLNIPVKGASFNTVKIALED